MIAGVCIFLGSSGGGSKKRPKAVLEKMYSNIVVVWLGGVVALYPWIHQLSVLCFSVFSLQSIPVCFFVFLTKYDRTRDTLGVACLEALAMRSKEGSRRRGWIRGVVSMG